MPIGPDGARGLARPITRQVFLRQLAGGGLALSLVGCGGGGGDPPGAEASTPQSCSASSFSANHGHSLTIPAADLDSTAARTYSIQGTALHDHTVTLSAAQLGQIKQGQTVIVASTEGLLFGTQAHIHDMSASRCA